MEIDFIDKSLERVYLDPTSTLGHGQSIDKGFRKKIQMIKAAVNELDLRKLRSLHYEKMKGKRNHQHSIKINNQWRIILEKNRSGKRIVMNIIAVEDYH